MHIRQLIMDLLWIDSMDTPELGCNSGPEAPKASCRLHKTPWWRPTWQLNAMKFRTTETSSEVQKGIRQETWITWILNTAQVLFLPWAYTFLWPWLGFPRCSVPSRSATETWHRGYQTWLPVAGMALFISRVLLGISILRNYRTYYHISCHIPKYNHTVQLSTYYHII